MMQMQEEFDQLVFNKEWVQLVQACSAPGSDQGWVYTAQLDGEFDAETLEAIIYAMNNHPEWLKLKDPS